MSNEAKVRTYENENYQQFVEDMEEAGFEVEHYRGRYFYEGPAVRTAELQDVMGETAVKVQWDQMGRGYIVYPK